MPEPVASPTDGGPEGPSPRLAAWVERAHASDQVKRVRYNPFLTFFYPSLEVPDRLARLQRQTVVQPGSTAEVAAILAKAYELDEPVHVRQGTGLLSLDTPLPIPPGAVVVDLRRLASVRPAPQAGYVEVGPAVTLRRTNEVLKPLGFQFPTAVGNVQWGGLASINLSGHLVDAHAGKPGDFVLGLTVVLPDGTVLDTGTTSMRKVVGPDPTRLFIGGQALFGVITDLRLRLVPRPGGRTFACAVFDDPHGIVETVRTMYRDGMAYPAAMELVDASFARTSGMSELLGEQGHLLLLSGEGTDDGAADAIARALLDVARSNGATGARVLPEPEWDHLWEIRESPFRHMGAGEYLLGEALDVSLERMHEALDVVQPLLHPSRHGVDGVEGYLVAHIGAGTLHPLYACPSEWDYDRRVAACRALRERTLELKLHLDATVGEQGIFPQHARWFGAHYGAAAPLLIERLKGALDPKNLLNPGRIQPVGVASGGTA